MPSTTDKKFIKFVQRFFVWGQRISCTTEQHYTAGMRHEGGFWLRSPPFRQQALIAFSRISGRNRDNDNIGHQSRNQHQTLTPSCMELWTVSLLSLWPTTWRRHRQRRCGYPPPPLEAPQVSPSINMKWSIRKTCGIRKTKSAYPLSRTSLLVRHKDED